MALGQTVATEGAALPGADSAVAQDGEREGGRRRRRGGRGRGERADDSLNTQQDGTIEPSSDAAADNSSTEGGINEGAEQESRGRRQRGDRPRRDRRDRSAESSEAAEQIADTPAADLTQAAEAIAPVVAAQPEAATIEIAPAAVAEVVTEEEAAPAPEPYALPIEELVALAKEAGLEWVNSDADKIRIAQEAIANEPKPVHVPRERKAAVVLDEGPLILVETKKDLRQVTLPFEAAEQ